MSDTEIIQSLHPHLAAKAQLLIQHMDQKGHPIRITSGYRSPEDQARLYAQGRTTPGARVTNARPGMSWHQWRRAFDCCFLGPEPFSASHPWDALGSAGQALGLRWGGDFGDRPHFEMPGPLSLRLLAASLDGLRLDASGRLVCELQRALGGGLVIDGHFGPLTEAVLEDFQMMAMGRGMNDAGFGVFDAGTAMALETALEGGV